MRRAGGAGGAASGVVRAIARRGAAPPARALGADGPRAAAAERARAWLAKARGVPAEPGEAAAPPPGGAAPGAAAPVPAAPAPAAGWLARLRARAGGAATADQFSPPNSLPPAAGGVSLEKVEGGALRRALARLRGGDASATGGPTGTPAERVPAVSSRAGAAAAGPSALTERVKSGLSSAAASSAGAAQLAAVKAATVAREAAQAAADKAATLARDAASGASSAVVGGAARSVDAVKAATRQATSAAGSAALAATQRSADAVRHGAGRAAGAVAAGVRDSATRTADAARSVGADAGRAVGDRVAALDPRIRLTAWLKWARNWLIGGLFVALSAYAFGSAAPYAIKDLLLEIDRRRREESRNAAAPPPAIVAAPANVGGAPAPATATATATAPATAQSNTVSRWPGAPIWNSSSNTSSKQGGHKPDNQDGPDVLPHVPEGWEWGPPIGSLQSAEPTAANVYSTALQPAERTPWAGPWSWPWPGSDTRR
jgi:hypothetical protein